jgi:hypothetical protein
MHKSRYKGRVLGLAKIGARQRLTYIVVVNKCKQIQVENDRAGAGQNRGQVTPHLPCRCKQV